MTDLRSWAAHLRRVDIEQACSPTMSRAGGNMMRRARELAPTGTSLTASGYADSISFEKDGPLAVECFARDRGQGPLAGIIEYGHGPNGPHPHFLPALDEEVEPTCDWLAVAVTKAIQS